MQPSGAGGAFAFWGDESGSENVVANIHENLGKKPDEFSSGTQSHAQISNVKLTEVNREII